MAFQRVFHKALAKQPDQRYSRAAEFVDALADAFIESPEEVTQIMGQAPASVTGKKKKKKNEGRIEARRQAFREAVKAGDHASCETIFRELKQAGVEVTAESRAMNILAEKLALAEKEKAELAVIEEFLPQQMSEDETRAAIAQIKADLGAEGMKDMGRVMGELKARHGATLDMSKASGLVKEALS